MQIKLVQDQAGMDALASSWNQLLEKSHSKSPFQLFDFQRTWWQHKGGGEWPNGKLMIMLGYGNSGELEGIAPLFIDRDEGLNTLRFIGSHEIADFLDLICTQDRLEDFIENLLDFLVGEFDKQWDAIDLCNILDDSASSSILEKLAPARGLKFVSEKIQASPLVVIPQTFDAFVASLESKNRHELRRKLRNSAAYPVPIELEIIDSALGAEQALKDFFLLMNNIEEKALFLQGEMQSQMFTLAKQALINGWGHLAFLKVGNDRIAAYLNFDYDNRIWAYNAGYDPKMADISPGWILTSKMIEWCILNKKVVFDFMRGAEEYKYRFGAKDRFVMRNIITKK